MLIEKFSSEKRAWYTAAAPQVIDFVNEKMRHAWMTNRLPGLTAMREWKPVAVIDITTSTRRAPSPARPFFPPLLLFVAMQAGMALRSFMHCSPMLKVLLKQFGNHAN